MRVISADFDCAQPVQWLLRVAGVRLPFVCLVLIAAACDRGPTEVGAASSALATEVPAWVASGTVVAERFGQRLVRGEVQAAPEGTDVRMPVPLAVVRADGSTWVAPADAVEAALLDGAVAWVDLEGTLLVADGPRIITIDQDVHGELAVDPSGQLLAYALRPGERAGVWLASVEGGAPRHVTPGLAVADRPLFVGGEQLVVVGSRPGGIAGVWTVRYRDAAAQPVSITNGALRVGTPLGPTFVPPPAYHASMRVESGVLVYDDGEREQRVELPR